MVGMKEVAKKACVSIATVSAVVNETKFVSDELRIRVEEAIKELGYRPNRVARRLKGKTSNIIAATVTEITNPFYPYMVKGIEDAAKNNGYNLLLSTTEDNEENEENIINMMIYQGVDGVILSTIENIDSKVLATLDEYRIPKVLVNRVPEGYKGSFIVIDSVKVGEIATQYLIDLGHKNIGFIGGKRLNSHFREKGFRKIMKEKGFPINEHWVRDGGYDFDEAYKEAKALLEINDIKPTALFAASDMMAMGVIEACLDMGRAVPEDISVIGSDNIFYSEYFKVPLTTIDVQTYHMGKEGFDVLQDLILKEEEGSPTQIFLEPKLIVRESTNKINNFE